MRTPRSFLAVALTIPIALVAACGDNHPAKETVCGDAVIAGDEVCDDGNTTDGDGCNADCRPTRCGDGLLAFSEACDDGNDIDGDGCDTNCTESFCGNGILAEGEACDDGNTRDGDGCDSNCRPSGCGNGATGGTETCDDGNAIDGDGCDSNCQTTACGNGIKTGTEQCDDGNSVSLDGCSANCATEVAEVEPNEDGSVSTGGSGIAGNDFATAAPDANGELTGSTLIVAALTPAGDEDVFKVTNTGTAPVNLQLDTWNLATGFGVGTSCGTSINTGINVRNAAGTVLASNDTRMSGDNCAGLVYPLFANETVYVHVTESGDNAVIANYALEIVFKAVICGDGNVGPGEQCDDMNTTVGDGCSATCQIENSFSEMEPNEDGTPSTGGTGIDGNDYASANADMYGPSTSSKTAIASIMPAGDEDVFAIKNTGTTYTTVSLDVWNLAIGFGIGVPCGTSIDTALHVRDAAGNSVGSNDDRNGASDRCSTLKVYLKPNETLYAHVSDFGDSDQIPMYALKMVFSPSVCGDMTVTAGEQCDDGNATAGDGCSATCQVEAVCNDGMVQPGEQCEDGNTMAGDGCDGMCQLEGVTDEVEPNEDGNVSTGGSGIAGNDFGSAIPDANGAFTGSVTLAASLMPSGDEDVFKFTNTGTTYAIVKFDTWNMAPTFGINVACGTSINTGITLRSASGSSLASNDDRVTTTDQCSSVTYNMAPGESVYAHVVANGDVAQIATYALVVGFAPVVCGDTMIGPGEQCDDGNTNAGDGCSPVCENEPVCGNSMLEVSEQCDDGNANPGDGCSATCQLENAVTEVEPNEDGTPSIGGSGTVGNDFGIANPDTNGAFTASTRIAAKLTPAGDEDIFKITNTASTYAILSLDVWNIAPGFGVGVPCGTSIDTGMHLRDAAGVSLASNDDRNGASDRCSTLTFTMAPGASVYAHVIEFSDDETVASYALVVNIAPVVCGNSAVGPGEQCDDGNTTAGDGCSATCQVEGTAEIEPNEDGSVSTGGTGIVGNDFGVTAPDANGVFTVPATILATLTPAGDEDVFKFTNSSANEVIARFDTWNLAFGFGIGIPCGTSINTGLTLRDAAGASLASNDDRNGSTDRCAGLSYVIPAGGTVYAHVVESGDDAVVANYTLVVKYTPVICGDGTMGGSEQCDDGTTTAGDGCSSVCKVEGLTEIEPNEDGTPSTGGSGIVGNDFGVTAPDANGAYTAPVTILAALSPAGDEDVFKFTNSSATEVIARFDTWNLAPGFGPGVPCGSSIDIGVTLRDAAGVSLASNDDRNGSTDRCAGLSYVIPAGGTVYAHIVESGDNAVVANYALVVRSTPVVCGDGVVGGSEQCDDGNTTGGDGCSATCQGIVEIEPNDTTAQAMTSTLQVTGDVTIAGAIGAVADKDVFQVTVASQTVVRFETFTSARDCASGTTIDMRLFNSASALIIADTSGMGIASCAAITIPLAPGTYFVQVEERGNNATVPAYLLEVAYQDSRGTEIEPNETVMTSNANLLGENESFVFGDHMVGADVDVYAITVDPGQRIRAEIVEGDRAVETCESNSIDSRLTLFDQNGVQLVDDDDDGRGFCSLIDGSGASPLDASARNASATPQTYYLMVRQSSLVTAPNGEFVYRLQVTLR